MNPRKTFQLFFTPEAAAGSGAGAAKVDESGDGAAKGGAAAAAGDGAKTPEQIAADKKVVDDAAAAAAAKKAPEGETAEAKAVREAAEKKVVDDAAAAAAAKKTPEKYVLKVGKDAETFIDDGDLKLVEKLARDKGLTNEQAQSIVDERAGALLEQSIAFRAITEADPTYGGDKLATTEKHAKLALDRLRPAGTPRGDSFRKILAKTGFGNNLDVVSFLADIGAGLAEDSPGADGGAPASSNADAASKLYDHPTSKAGG